MMRRIAAVVAPAVLAVVVTSSPAAAPMAPDGWAGSFHAGAVLDTSAAVAGESCRPFWHEHGDKSWTCEPIAAAPSPIVSLP